MSFAIQGRRLPSLFSFAHCEAHAERRRQDLTKRRLQQWDSDTLPLCEWNEWSKRMVWIEDGADSRWSLIYYRTEVVGYFKDGRVLLDANYDTASTRTFFSELTPNGVSLYKHGTYGHTYHIDRQYHKVDRRPVTPWGCALVIDAAHNVLNPQDWVVKKTVADVARRKEIRARLKPFLTWYDAMTSVGNSMAGVIGANDGRGTTEAPWELVQALMNGGSNADDLMLRAHAIKHLMTVNRSVAFWQQQQDPHTPALIRPVRNALLELAYQGYDGYQMITITAPAGELP